MISPATMREFILQNERNSYQFMIGQQRCKSRLPVREPLRHGSFICDFAVKVRFTQKGLVKCEIDI